MANVKMSIKQWEDYQRAVKSGDKDKAQRIMDMGYQPDYDPAEDVSRETKLIEAAEVEDEEQLILDDVAAGLENKEIYEKYGVSPKKLSMIKAGAK